MASANLFCWKSWTTCAFSLFHCSSCAASGVTQNEASSNMPAIFFVLRPMWKPSRLPNFPAASRSAPDKDEGAPVVGQVLAVALAHRLALFELRLPQRFVLVQTCEPFLIEQCHQLLRLFVRHRPHAHHHCFRAGFLQRPPQPEYAFAILLFTESRLACAQHHQ